MVTGRMGRAGKGSLGCMTTLLVFGAIVYFGLPVAQIYVRQYQFAEEMRTATILAPNLTDAVIGSFTRSPLDAERCLPNMREGDLLVGAFTNGQVGFDRPFRGAGTYRTHLPGLYLCGSSSHPGGNVTGLPGYNSAQVILSDLGAGLNLFAERTAAS